MSHYAIGSHLKVARLGYTHHGIYIGGGKVIHYAGFCQAFKSAPVEITTLAEFQGNAKVIKVVSYASPRFDAQEIVARAKSRLAEDKYSLFFNNCEHFAHWCVMGEAVSSQIKLLKKVACGIVTMLLLPALSAHASGFLSL